MPEPERPRVTVSNPRVPGLAVVQGAGVQGEEPSAQPRALRDRARRWVALALAVAMGFGASQLLQSQRERQEADGRRALVDLQIRAGDSYAVTETGTTLGVQVEVANRGEVPVTLLEAAVQGSALAGLPGDEPVPVGGSRSVVLEQPVVCPDQVPPDPPGPQDRLVLRARTEAGTQEVQAVLPPGVQAALSGAMAASCGQVSDDEALMVFVESTVERPGEALLTLQLLNRSSRDLRVVAVEERDDLTAELHSAAGELLPLPLLVPASRFGGGEPELTQVRHLLSLRIEPALCDQVGGGAPLVDLRYVVVPEGGGADLPVHTASAGDGGDVLGRLLGDACG